MFDVKGLKVGDKVKVISEELGRHVGEIGEVKAIVRLGTRFLVKVAFGKSYFCYRTDYHNDVIEKVESKFKIGDKVRYIGHALADLEGKQGVIRDNDGSLVPYYVEFEGFGYWWSNEDSLELIEKDIILKRKKIIIYSVGNEVFAKLIYSDKSCTVASAKCNPSDNFDILVGAQIALQRLAKKLGSKLVLPTKALDAIDIEVKIKDKENFEVV